MAFQSVFMRYEVKYMLTSEQKERLKREMTPFMLPDRYGRTTIRNLYFDTDNYRLIRRSIEKPVYKEKLRLRSYEQAGPASMVFAELKKKYRDVVYKRRISLPEETAMAWVCGRQHCGKDSQIAKEICYFLDYYAPLRPAVYLSYDREAYYSKGGSDFRVTFDDKILCRQEALSLREEPYGVPLLKDDMVLMEIKCSGGIPLWMTQFLSAERLYKTSFSKYGTAYQTMIFQTTKEAILHA